MSDKTAAATSGAMLKELAEQNAWLQQRAITNAARAGAAEARVQELQAELETAREYGAAVKAELDALKPAPEEPGGTVVNLDNRRE